MPPITEQRVNDAYERSPDSPGTMPVARFLLTFDDGPHERTDSVLRVLAHNPIQSDIKALFFVQTRHLAAGGSAEGRAMMHRTQAEGHGLGLHTATPRGHLSHIRMAREELERSLQDGIDDLERVTGRRPQLVRPPYWLFNQATLSAYGRQGLHMVLSDVKAFDGVEWKVLHHLRRRIFHSQLARTRARFQAEGPPVLRRTIPIIVTLHDTNAFTTAHLTDYLEFLVEAASRLNVPLHDRPFLSGTGEVLEAGLHRAVFHNKRAPSVERSVAVEGR